MTVPAERALDPVVIARRLTSAAKTREMRNTGKPPTGRGLGRCVAAKAPYAGVTSPCRSYISFLRQSRRKTPLDPVEYAKNPQIADLTKGIAVDLRGSRILLHPAAADGTVASETTKPFGAALRELLLEHDYATRSGKPNWRAFAAELEGVHYETLRKAAAGERRPSLRLLEESARALRLRPEYFLEYRLHRAQRDFDPDAVGLDDAVRNLESWARDRGSPV
jgi:hypothetical protein